MCSSPIRIVVFRGETIKVRPVGFGDGRRRGAERATDEFCPWNGYCARTPPERLGKPQVMIATKTLARP